MVRAQKITSEIQAEDQNEETNEFPGVSTTDSAVGTLSLTVKAGQEIHKKRPVKIIDVEPDQIKESPNVIDEDEADHQTKPMQVWAALKNKLSLSKPKRDPFIASFFDFDSE